MRVADILREQREQINLSQDEMAKRLSLARSTYSAYERNQRRIPEDVINKAVKEFDNIKIIAEYSFDQGIEFFNVPLLDNVDTYPHVVIDALIEESREMIAALFKIKSVIKNKIQADQLSKEDIKQLMVHEEQVGDLYAALKMHFVTMQKYGINVKDVERRCLTKLRNKGFIKKEKARLI